MAFYEQQRMSHYSSLFSNRMVSKLFAVSLQTVPVVSEFKTDMLFNVINQRKDKQ